MQSPTRLPRMLPMIGRISGGFFSRAVVALFMVWVSTCNSFALAGKNSPRVGDAAPPLTLSEVVQGPAIGEISWQKLNGKVVVLEFWGTSCGPCIAAIPHWNQLVDEFSSKPVVFLSVSDDNKDYLNAFLKRKPIKGWLALDQFPTSLTATAFDVVGIPHTVIVDAKGRIAAIIHPSKLDSLHLEEILEGKPSTLPVFEPYLPDANQNTVVVTNPPPTTVQVSIQGPFPQPKGAFGSHGWGKPDYTFTARKAYLRDVLPTFFDIHSELVTVKRNLPDGLYDISAVAPPDKLSELRAQFVELLKTNLGITVLTETREVESYAMTVCTSNAPGLKATSKNGGGGERPGGFYLKGVYIKRIAYYLERAVNKPVVDETGLTGLWAVDVQWEKSNPELPNGHSDPVKVIQAVREQLGLELKPVKRELPVLMVEVDSKARSNQTLTVQVQDAEGLPLPNTAVVCVDATTNAILEGTTITGGSEVFQTDTMGQFAFRLQHENLFFMVATDTGFGLGQSRFLVNNPVLVVQPWGHIEGTRINRNRPVANLRIMINFDWLCLSDDISTRERVWMSPKTITDASGRFVFTHVPPAGIDLRAVEGCKELWYRVGRIEVKPGEDKHIQIATQGRTIVGRVESGNDLPDDLDLTSCDVNLVPADQRHRFIPNTPEEFDTPEKRTAWWQDWYNSEAGQNDFRPLDKDGSPLTVQSNGAFASCHVVAPGKYRVTGSLWRNGNKVAKVDQYLEIPDSDDTNALYDMGKVILKPSLQIGDIMPNPVLKTLDGKPLKLSDFRGKYILLDFWATWCGPCIAEVPNLKDVYETFGGDSRLVMISLSLDEDTAAPKAFVRDKKIPWTQVFLGDWGQDTVTKALEVNFIPSIWLIGPDGRIVSRNLRGQKIREAVASTLHAPNILPKTGVRESDSKF